MDQCVNKRFSCWKMCYTGLTKTGCGTVSCLCKFQLLENVLYWADPKNRMKYLLSVKKFQLLENVLYWADQHDSDLEDLGVKVSVAGKCVILG